jgi:hypothetical protein
MPENAMNPVARGRRPAARLPVSLALAALAMTVSIKRYRQTLD